MRPRKPFPSRVRWWKLWKHRWTVLNFLNQIAYGTPEKAVFVLGYYGGCEEVGKELFLAAKDIIDVAPRSHFPC